MPPFNGDVYKYIKANLKYPQIAFENGIEGKSMVEFTVNEDGTIDKNSIKTLKNLGWGLDEEAVRIVTNMSVWEPGKLNGKNVKVRMVLPIVFKLP